MASVHILFKLSCEGNLKQYLKFYGLCCFCVIYLPVDNIRKKGTAVPLQAWIGPVVPRKLRFPDYMTTAQDGGKVVSPTHRPPLPPGNALGTHFC